MHVRVGMSSPYLSDEFMGHIRTCVEKARNENMLAWLYDEDKWPSGYAGGYVTKKRENRQKYLLFTPKEPTALEEGEKLLGILFNGTPVSKKLKVLLWMMRYPPCVSDLLKKEIT